MATRLIAGPAGSIFIDDGGRGGIPVVFIHSFAGNVSHWSTQLMHLRASRQAVAFDLRGHGNSDAPDDNDYSIPSLCSDLSAVVRSLNLRKFVLVGHSLGGTVALAYAASHPERVEGLVLVETPGNIPTDHAADIFSWLESDYENVMRTYGEKLLSRAQPQVSTQVRHEMSTFNRESAMAILRAMFDFNPLPALAAYHGPRLAVITTHNESPHDLHKVVPDLPFRTLPGTSHWLHMDRPADFNLLLDEFLGMIDLQKSTFRADADREQVQQLLERMGRALSRGKLQEISACFETPAVLLTDAGARVLADRAMIEQMFRKAIEAYRSQELGSIRPEIERMERLSNTLAEVDVRWPAFNEEGIEKASEYAHYIIHFGKDGEPHIRVAVSRSTGAIAA